MLWELEQIELRLQELEGEMERVRRDALLSESRKESKFALLDRQHTAAYLRRREIMEQIAQDPALARQLDRLNEQKRKKAAEPKPLPEAERGLQETEGPITGKEADARDLYRNYAKKWHERSVTDRSNENAKLLESERDQGWEP